LRWRRRRLSRAIQPGALMHWRLALFQVVDQRCLLGLPRPSGQHTAARRWLRWTTSGAPSAPAGSAPRRLPDTATTGTEDRVHCRSLRALASGRLSRQLLRIQRHTWRFVLSSDERLKGRCRCPSPSPQRGILLASAPMSIVARSPRFTAHDRLRMLPRGERRRWCPVNPGSLSVIEFVGMCLSQRRCNRSVACGYDIGQLRMMLRSPRA